MEYKRVSFSKYINGIGEVKYLKENLNGMFLRWADHIEFHDGKAYNRTVGLVEGEDKQVYMVLPDGITVTSS